MTADPPRKDEKAGDAATVIQPTPPPAPTPTPLPASLSRAGTGLPLEPSDLSGDRLLAQLPRMELEGRQLPSIGDIPLLRKLGQGGMGAVYLGYKPRLRQMVAVKVLPLHVAMQPDMESRFVREAQIAASIESPHLVGVSDVDERDGILYLVMEYVNGPSAGAYLKERMAAGKPLAEVEALDICIAATKGLAAAHENGVVHRDLKPDNILIPRSRDGALRLAEARLADLGLARSETQAALTATHAAMGTPGYMAPEQAMSAHRAGKPADVFALGATLYALLGGRPPFKGESSTAVILATIQEPHAPIRTLRSDVGEATAHLVDVCLEKAPEKRFADAPALLDALFVCRRAASHEVVEADARTLIGSFQGQAERGAPVPVSDPGATAIVEDAATIPVTSAPSLATMPVGSAPSLATVAVTPAPETAPVPVPPAPRRSLRLFGGIAVALAVVALTVALGLAQRGQKAPAPAAAAVQFGIGYSSEKSNWLPWAAEQFAATPEGRGVKVGLYSMDEEEIEAALARADRRLHVWAPTTSLYRGRVEKAWREKNGTSPIVEDTLLSVSSQVFVMWASRHEAFRKKYGEVGFGTLAKAMDAGTWDRIAKKPEWGPFTFAITDPARFANGLSGLCLMAAELQGRERTISVEDASSPQFHALVKRLEPGFRISSSAAETMRDFVLKGPSSYDGVFIEESLALTLGDDAADRWEPVQILYPKVNFWNDARYYVLDVPWSSPEERRAASAFGKFLLTEAVQERIVREGLRPAKPHVKIRVPESPFVRQKGLGAQLSVPIALDPPDAATIDALMAAVKTKPIG